MFDNKLIVPVKCDVVVHSIFLYLEIYVLLPTPSSLFKTASGARYILSEISVLFVTPSQVSFLLPPLFMVFCVHQSRLVLVGLYKTVLKKF